MQKTHPQSEIVAITDETIRLKRSSLGPALLSDLTDELIRDNPNHAQMVRMAAASPQKYAHAKMPPRTIQSIFEDGDTVFIPRGCRALLIELATKYGRTIKWHDERIFKDRDPGMMLKPDVELIAYQKSNLMNITFNEEGVVWMPCGSGKTVTGVAVVMTLAQPTIIFVHSTDLMDGWLRELASKAIVPGGVGQWGGGVKKRGYVTVAMIQTLARMPREELRKLLDGFSCAILDECHHCPANTFLNVMNMCKARYRYGFTATKERKDGMHFLMHDTIGPVIAHVTQDELEAAGRSQPVEVVNVMTTFASEYTAHEWTELLQQMTNDQDRNDLIIQNILDSWNAGHFPLVLSDRVPHCRELARRLETNGMTVGLLIGAVPRPIRTEMVKRARGNLIDAIVATSVADEGLDIPALSCVHLTTPSSNEGKLEQRIGRIRRPVDGKPTSVVYDYVDVMHKSCDNKSKARRRFYRRWGFTSRTIYIGK